MQAGAACAATPQLLHTRCASCLRAMVMVVPATMGWLRCCGGIYTQTQQAHWHRTSTGDPANAALRRHIMRRAAALVRPSRDRAAFLGTLCHE